MASQNSKDQSTSRTFDEPAPALEELDEAELAFRHAVDDARAQMEDRIATIATEYGKSYRQIARHFFVDVEGKWEDDYSVLPDEEKQALFEWLQEGLDASDAIVSHRQTSKDQDDEHGILVQTRDACMTLNRALNEELIDFNATSEIQYFLLVARSKAESIVNAEPSMHSTSTGGEKSLSQMSHLKPSELAASFEAFSLDEVGIYGVEPEENPVKNMIQAMLHDQLYALTGDETGRLEYSNWDEKMTRVEGTIIECDFVA